MAREKKLPGYKTNAPAAYKEFKCVFTRIVKVESKERVLRNDVSRRHREEQSDEAISKE